MKLFKITLFSLGILLCAATFNGSNAADDAEKVEGEVVHFVELSPLMLPVINDRGVSQMISLIVAVEVDSQEKADKVTKFSPRLTDAYLSDLYGALSNKNMEKGMVPIAYLKERLNVMSNKVLGDEVVSDVLVQVMQSRRT